MRILHFIKQITDDKERLLSFFTPVGAENMGWGKRVLLAGGTATALGLSLLAAVNAMVMLLLAVGVIYYLLTQLVGVKLEFDPRTLMHQAQRYASASSAPN